MCIILDTFRPSKYYYLTMYFRILVIKNLYTIVKKGLPSLATSTFASIQLSNGLAIKQKSSKKLGYPSFWFAMYEYQTSWYKKISYSRNFLSLLQIITFLSKMFKIFYIQRFLRQYFYAKLPSPSSVPVFIQVNSTRWLESPENLLPSLVIVAFY